MGGDRSKDINYANKEESRRSVQFDLAGQSGASRHEFGGNKVNQAGEMIMGILTPDAEVTGLSVELGGVHCNILAHAKQGSFLTAIDADLKLDFDTNDVGEMSNLELAANGKGEKLIKVGFGTIKNKPNEALVKALNKNLKLEGDGQVKIVRVKVENGRIRIEMLTEKGIQAEAKAEGEALLARARADEEIAATTRMGELAADVRRRVKDFPPPPLSMPSMAEKVAAKPEKNPHGPAGFDPAGEEISVVSGEPVGTAAGRWPGDEPPPVKDGHVAKVYEKVPDLPLPPIKPSKPGREMVDESGGQGPARSNLAGSEPQRAEGEIPYWLAAMEAGEAGAPMTEMAAGVPAAEPVEGREPEKRQAVKESKFLGVQDFAEGEVLVDGDGYVVIRPDGELFFVHGGNYQLDEVVRKDWQKVEMRLDDDGNLHAVMPLVEQKKGEVRTYMENLDNITMITDREVIFTRRGDNQWLGVESATGGEKQWILVENQPDGNFKLTRDNLLPIEKMVNPTEAINVLAPRGMVSEVKIFAAGEDPGRANEFIAIFHPEMHEMGLFTLTFSKNKIVLSDGEQERKINWRKREQISFPGIPLVILLEKRGGGWQIRVEKKNLAAEAEEAEMPVMPRRENKSLFSAARIYNFLTESAFGIRPTEALIFNTLVLKDMATDPNMLGLTASAFLIFGAVNLLGRLKEMRRISQEGLMRDFRNGFIVGMAVSATGGVIDLLINSITQDMFKHSTGKAVVMRGLFNYLLPRFFPYGFTEDDKESLKAMEEGVRLGVILATSIPVLVNLSGILIAEIQTIHNEVPTQAVTQPPTQMATETPVTPEPVVPTVTPQAPIPSVMPMATDILATATQMVGQVETFIQNFDLTPDKPYDGEMIMGFVAEFNKLVADSDLKAEAINSGILKEVVGKDGWFYWALDQNKDGIIDALITNRFQGTILVRTGVNSFGIIGDPVNHYTLDQLQLNGLVK